MSIPHHATETAPFLKNLRKKKKKDKKKGKKEELTLCPEIHSPQQKAWYCEWCGNTYESSAALGGHSRGCRKLYPRQGGQPRFPKSKEEKATDEAEKAQRKQQKKPTATTPKASEDDEDDIEEDDEDQRRLELRIPILHNSKEELRHSLQQTKKACPLQSLSRRNR